jgi:DNA-binding response OmpR family regulator
MQNYRPLVLIIDENRWIRELYTIERAERGYEVVAIGDVAFADEMIVTAEPDLVLVDPHTKGKCR